MSQDRNADIRTAILAQIVLEKKVNYVQLRKEHYDLKTEEVWIAVGCLACSGLIDVNQQTLTATKEGMECFSLPATKNS